MTDLADCLKTPLYDLHVRLGGKMVPFAGYAMPVQYGLGVMGEHNHTRTAAGLFDVSHMGQARVHGLHGQDPAKALERLMPGLLSTLKPGKMRYSLLLNETGGIEDDLMVTRTHDAEGSLYIVVNAAFKSKDYDLIEDRVSDAAVLEPMEDHALLALQGPAAETVLARLAPEVADLSFMEATSVTLEGVVCWVSRSGYTGEDGYEISIPASEASAFADRLLGEPEVEAIGLGARDSLRLEAGLCLSGQDFDGSISPVEANLGFALSKKRLEAADFDGAERILSERATGASKVRVGIKPEGRAPARTGTDIADADGSLIGTITSGGFGPTVGGPVAMGFVTPEHAAPGTEIQLMIRGKPHSARVADLPFIPQRYKRKS